MLHFSVHHPRFPRLSNLVAFVLARVPFVALALLALAALPAASQTFSPTYQFTLPPTDTATAPFLPVFPPRLLGPSDFVSVAPDGHFTAGGGRIRFFGTNCVADGAFPSKNFAWFVAGRLRKMGFNLVRFHHMDNPWTGSLFYNEPDTRHLNPDVLDRLDCFLGELKKNSVYADINLHVSRTFRQSDGVPYADSLGEYAKGFTIFDPLLIRLQKEYARQLLTHVSPYTGLSLANDPVMAMVEITNENSIFRFWEQGDLKPFSAGGMLPVYHQHLLDSLWCGFLAAHYGSTAALAAAWNGGLLPGENLEDKTVRRIDYAECGSVADARVKDITAFYLKLQSDYFLDMRSFLHDSLGVRVPVVGTNLNFGLPDEASMAVADYMDNHAYWDHPSFPNIPWSSTDWSITNTSMVRADYAAGTIGYLFAGVPVVGKPFTVSEYDHPFPNRYEAEGPVFLSAYASLHAADAIMFFDYNGGTDWITDRVAAYFDYHRNTAKMSLMPSLAAAFRGGLIAPAAQTVAMQYTRDDLLLAPKYDTRPIWEGGHLAPAKLALLHAVRAASFDAAATTVPPPEPVPPYQSDTRQITWNPAGALTIAAPGFAAVTGFPEQLATSKAGDLALRSVTDHATLTWLPLDGRPLVKSRRSLLTLSTRIQNAGMVWDGTTTMHDQWGTPPTQMQPVNLGLTLHLLADSVIMTPLSETGDRRSGSWTLLPADTNLFLVDIDQNRTPTPWFVVEAFGQGTTAAVGQEEQRPASFLLEQNYPNPFNPLTTIICQWPTASRVRLSIYDLLGREVVRLIDGIRPPGRFAVPFDGTSLASGVYLCRLAAVPLANAAGIGRTAQVRKITLVR